MIEPFQRTGDRQPTVDKPIANPWHSRPLDVHRWSDHPEALRLAESIWQAHFSDYRKEERKPGPKPKTSYRQQLKVVLLDLYVAWLTDPELSIGLPMSSNGWDGSSRYNALHLTRKIVPMVARLHEVGLIGLAAGSYGGPFSLTNRNTRIRAAAPLVALFQEIRLRQTDIGQFPEQECIILKDKGTEEDGAKQIEYHDTQDTERMRVQLKRYNQLLSETFIDIPTLEQDYVERVSSSGANAGQVVRIPTASSRVFVRRIFSRGSWEKNGRFYGGWWQQVGKDQRKLIFINDQPTIEVDFRSMHVSILSFELGVISKGDPYTLAEGLVPGTPAKFQRVLVKQLVLTAINARDRKSAFAAFRDGWPTRHFGKEMTNAELHDLLDAFTAAHPHLAPSLCSDQGIRLMYVDSCIAARVINAFTVRRLPVLCVHDSFIVPYQHVGVLKRSLEEASIAIIGHPLPVEASGPGLDEWADEPLYVQQDFINWRQTARCQEYLDRLATHEAWLETLPPAEEV